MPVSYLHHNGQLLPSGTLPLSPDSRALRYGDGFFETAKMINGTLVLEQLHLRRLFYSLQTLQFNQPAYFSPAYIQAQIEALTRKNEHRSLARVRLMVYRGEGTLYDTSNNEPHVLIQSWALSGLPVYNANGLTVGIYTDSRKAADAFSHIKSNNYLPYAMAARWSQANKLDDALVMNCYGRIAEATTSNVFIVKGGVVQTPPLSEGCISGVVRTFLLAFLQQQNITYEEKPLTPEAILEADELFLTNAGFYIRQVGKCGAKIYTHAFSEWLFQKAIVPLISV